MLILQALEDGGMLAVHRQQLDAVFLYRVRYQVAAGHKAFLVGEGQIMSAFDCSQRGRQTGNTDYRVQYNVGAIHGSQSAQPLWAFQQFGCVGGTGKGSIQFLTGGRVHHGHIFRVELFDLLLQDLHARVRCKAKDAVAVHPGNIKALGTDGTGGAKQSNGFWHVDIPLWKGTAPKVQCRLLFWFSGPGLLIRRPLCLRFTGTHKRSNAPRWTPAAR